MKKPFQWAVEKKLIILYKDGSINYSAKIPFEFNAARDQRKFDIDTEITEQEFDEAIKAIN
jgi:hypothetical protein